MTETKIRAVKRDHVFLVCVEGGEVARFGDADLAMAEAIRLRREGLPGYPDPEVVTVVVATAD